MAIRLGFKRRNTWKGVDLMNLIPERACEGEVDPTTGLVSVLVPRYGNWPFNRLLQPRLRADKRNIKVPLETRGSFLWTRMDGRLTIGELVPEFELEFSDDKSDVPQRLAAFLYQMYQNKFIRFLNDPK